MSAIIVALAALLLTHSSAAGQAVPQPARPSEMRVQHLRCEQLRAPQGIDAKLPRLSWTLASDKRGQRQTAYQILVASSPDRLNPDECDVWDSGRMESDQNVLVNYAGPPLRSHQQCYWKVRVWDREGSPTDWSEPSEWLMGQVGATQWPGEWIGSEVPKRIETVTGANWIAFPENDPAVSAPPGVSYFRRAFEIPAGREIDSAIFRITADDRVAIFLNGRDLGSRSGPNSTKELDITHRLLAGGNIIAAAVTNDGPASSPTGLVGWLRIRFVDGESMQLVSDREWRTSRSEADLWNAPQFDDTEWIPAKVLGEVGMEPWGAVRHAESRRLPARYLRKPIQLDKPIARAVVSYSGLGTSELWINGQRIGNQVLSPAMMEYPRRLPYTTRDVTTALRAGDNAIGVVLGAGRFYAPRSEVYAAMPSHGSPMLKLHLEVEHTDGTTTQVVSDASWRMTDDGPILTSNEYDGEEYDARRELTGWDQPDYDDSQWAAAEMMNATTETLSFEMMEPIRVTQRLRPVSVHEPRPGVYVFDMGQNIVGWCRLHVRGPAGATVRLRHAETLLSNGELALANIRTAKATDLYTLKGAGNEVWEPRFTYHGFRYVEVTGYPGRPGLNTIEGCVVHDDLEKVGTFECSNELLNQIYGNAVWGTRGNYRSVPTDCPQRDERQGWLGDRLDIARGESYVFDVAAFYTKWLRDIRDAQKPTGSLPDVAPAHWPTYTDNVVWPSASVLTPGMLLQQYADTRPIERQYECNKRWVRYMDRFVNDGLIPKDSYGDWCVPPEDPLLIHSQGANRKTDTTLLASAFFAYDLEQMRRHAELLNRPEDARWFGERSGVVRMAINERYLDADQGKYDNGTQTSCVIPIAFDLTPKDLRAAVFDQLVRNITERNDGHIATGLVGGQYLLRVLTDGGRADLAYRIATQRDYPSWGYMVSQGATTIWELWNGDTADPAMNSGNHVMLIGDLLTWLFEDLAGIAPAPEAPGFKRIVMRPQPVEGLNHVKASHRSPYGWIESEWRKRDAKLSWQITIPPNSTAILHLPTGSERNATESGRPLEESEGVMVLEAVTGRVLVEVQSGAYDFEMENSAP